MENMWGQIFRAVTLAEKYSDRTCRQFSEIFRDHFLDGEKIRKRFRFVFLSKQMQSRHNFSHWKNQNREFKNVTAYSQ